MSQMKDILYMECMYTNWRGVSSLRRFLPLALWYGSTEWHPEKTLLFRALDLEKNERRDFRLVDFDLSTLVIIEKRVN